MTALLALVPRWVWAALVAALAATSCKLTIDLGSVKLELEKSRVAVAERDVAIADANSKAAIQAAALSQAVVKAQNDAKKREADLRSAADAARSESDGLHGDLEALRADYDKLSRDAVIERAAAVGAVLDQCQRQYQGVAAKADRHASDVRTLIDAWPK